MTTTSKPDPLLGRVVDGRYRITRKLARGGMATVYLADDLRLTRTVAVKMMHENLGTDDDFVSRFDHEARAAARLSHPSVVSVFDQGMDGERPYIVMEFVEGATLRQLMTREAPLAPIRAIDLMSQIAAAVAAAHEAGIIHRDLKPENVLISPRGQLKVADFGLARAVTAHTATANGMLIGTVSYIAPELVTHGHADTRCDVYAMGVVLFEMLTGKKPHTGDTPIQVAYSHVHNEIAAPSTLAPRNGGPALPDYVDALVMAAAARQPADRPRDAKVLLDHLHAAREALARGVRSDPALAARMRRTSLNDAEQVTEQVPMLRPGGTTMSAPADSPANATLVFDPKAPGGPPNPSGLTAFNEGVPIPTPTAEMLRSRRAHSRRRGRNSLILLLAASLILGMGGWYLLAGRFTSTPDFTNLTQGQAQNLAAAKGFTLSFDADYSETIPVGQVVRTDPAKDARILFGGSIVAFLSKGPERYPVPSLAGRSVNDATQALTASHLALGKVTEVWDENVGIGLVVSASLDANKSVKPGTQVDLNVSKGPAPVPIVSMVGKTFDEAKAYYEAAGLVVARAPQDKFSTKIAAGAVMSQDPKTGSLAKGATITFTVSKGPEMVQVPAVRWMTADKATKALKDAGFAVKVIQTGGVFRRVAYTDPGEGSMAPKGSTITVYVS